MLPPCQGRIWDLRTLVAFFLIMNKLYFDAFLCALAPYLPIKINVFFCFVFPD